MDADCAGAVGEVAGLFLAWPFLDRVLGNFWLLRASFICGMEAEGAAILESDCAYEKAS